MKTLLDEFHSSFLHAMIYTEGELHIIVVEGFRGVNAENITILGQVIKGAYAINTLNESRLVEVCFSRPIACQLVNESFTSGDEYDLREDEFALQVLTQSRYLEYVRANHGWFEHIHGPGKHYRVCTENEVIDVVACEPPTVSLVASKQNG